MFFCNESNLFYSSCLLCSTFVLHLFFDFTYHSKRTSVYIFKRKWSINVLKRSEQQFSFPIVFLFVCLFFTFTSQYMINLWLVSSVIFDSSSLSSSFPPSLPAFLPFSFSFSLFFGINLPPYATLCFYCNSGPFSQSYMDG